MPKEKWMRFSQVAFLVLPPSSTTSLPAAMSLKDKASEHRIEEVTQDNASDILKLEGESSEPPPPVFTAAQEKKLWRKIDLKLMPILALLYMLSFIDRGNIGNAKLQGLTTELNLTGNQYNIALTTYFIPYAILECPANLVLKKFRPSRWLPGITVLWGVIVVLMGIVKNFHQLVGVRACLGAAEAGLFPGVVYYLTLWYPRFMLQYRIGLFFGAASIAGAFSGLLAYGISFMSGVGGLLGWSWIFILEGILTILAGLLAFAVMVDFPATAKFLTPEERAYIIWRKKYDNSSVGEEEHFEMRHLISAISDWQVWLHLLVFYSIVAPLYGITLFLPTIINSFGYTAAISQLLTVPPYVFATILVYVFAHFSDKRQIRAPFILIGLAMCLLGFAVNISDVPDGVKYFGIFFCVGGSYSVLPGIVAWLGNNLAGQYKRGIGMALQIGIGNFSGAIACNIYRAVDSPRYIVGHGIELMFIGIGFIAIPIIVLSYTRINSKRAAHLKDAAERGEPKISDDETRRLGDRAPDFKYTL